VRKDCKAENNYKMMNLPIIFVHRHKKKLSHSHTTLMEAMQEELHQFDRLQVWELVDKPFGKTVIKLKWLWKNKKDDDQTMIHNKARLVAKGTQVFSNLSDGRENGISQWKALYGLKQAPRAWYNELSKFLTSKGFTK
nr:hypothetical protein [Tanacetum cinerariifolium]